MIWTLLDRLRRRLSRWLLVDDALARAAKAESECAAMYREIKDSERIMIDLGARQGDTTIIVASQLMGGRVHVLHDNFGSIRQLHDFLDSHFPGWRSSRGRHDPRRIFDVPPGADHPFWYPRRGP